jgi:hypothetical protein
MRQLKTDDSEDRLPIAYTIPEAIRVSGIGRSRLYELIAAGNVDARKLGGRTLVLASSLRSFIAALPPAEIRQGQTRVAS